MLTFYYEITISMKKYFLSLLTLLMAVVVQGQMVEPVHFTVAMTTTDLGEGEIVFTAAIDAGWHVYSTDLGSDGPISATFNAVKMEGVQTVGRLKPRGTVVKKFDQMFGMQLSYFEQKACFVQKVKFVKPDYTIDCYLEYGACNDQMCLPPSEVAFKQSGKSPVAAAEPVAGKALQESPVAEEPAAAADGVAVAAVADSVAVAQTDSTAAVAAASSDLWAPITDDLQRLGAGDSLAEESLLQLLLMGFIGGLLAVCMPCIWPIIPMTVSFFLKRSKDDKKKGIRDAFTYGASIIVIYLGLGLLVTALFGSDTLNAMSTNAVFNVFLFILLVLFALSFFGWFEIKLPDGWATAVDSKASATSGLLSIFLMAFTLVLVSFSCTAPIIGLLLVQTTTTGNWLAPAVGMFGFALALSLPFTIFAMSPSWLKSAPKSGSWMTTIKIVLAFIELAFAFKFLSVADLAYGWHILDREVFLSIWIVIFAMLGAYLCGWLKFQEDAVGGELDKPKPVLSIMGGMASLAFAVYMVPGLWGAPCKAVSAFAPPMNTQDFNLNSQTVEAVYKDYDLGMAAARAQGKPVFIDFTGFGCVNCRKMEAAVWTDPRVADMLKNDYVLISLYVDDKTPLAEPMEVVDAQGQTKLLRTVGAKWSYLQSHKFGANAQPFYVALDPATGKPLTGSRGYNEDIDAYLTFLKAGLE